MNSVLRERLLALGIVVLALGLLLVAIPQGVVRPKSVRHIVLSPDFWPTILGWVLLAAGAALGLRALLMRAEPEPLPVLRGGVLRLAGLGAVLLALALLVQTVGMVWACIAAYMALLAMVRPARPLVAILVGIVLPLLLYAFFAKLAGVAIPQGVFVRLP